MDGSMSTRTTHRLEKLMARLKARTDRHGDPMPGFKQNVAALRAEIALLTENTEDGR
jgi:hypothetical protein